MEFMRVQHHETKQLINWFVDKKNVSQKEFENLKNKALLKGKKYNTSYTITDGITKNFIHVNHYN